MVIEKGKPWGQPGPLPPDGAVARSDREVRLLLEEARHRDEPFPVVGLLGGDLCRTLGGRGDEARLRSPDAMTFPIDVGFALLDGRLRLFVAHLVARRAWWRGHALVAMNAQWHGRWNLGPRAHPNDGRLDVYEAALPFGQVPLAWRRLASGSHVPHPAIRERRVAAFQHEWPRRTDVWLDGERVGAYRNLSVRLQPDACSVVV